MLHRFHKHVISAVGLSLPEHCFDRYPAKEDQEDIINIIITDSFIADNLK